LPYVAQTIAFANFKDLYEKAEKAIYTEGACFLNVLAPCPRGWGYPTDMLMQINKLAVDTCYWPLYEVENGKYKIEIIASDSSNNTTIKSTTLTIGKIDDIPSNVCKYGNNEYDSEKYILAVDISENGCAIDPNLYKEEQQYSAINRIMDEETERLQKEFKKLKGTGTIHLYRNPTVVLNKEETGIVGYTLHVKMEITENGNTELVEEYDLTLDGKRIFTVNKYNLE